MSKRFFVILGLSLVGEGYDLVTARAQAAQPSDQETNRDGPAHEEFFSGSVQEVSEHTVKVARSLPGKAPEQRVFVMDPDTVVEGRLKRQVRVTVGYRSHDGQDHAWRIIVREPAE